MVGTLSGRVVRLVREKGFGFVMGDDGIERFFHYTGVRAPGGLNALVEGMVVTFDPDQPREGKGPRATNLDVAT